MLCAMQASDCARACSTGAWQVVGWCRDGHRASRAVALPRRALLTRLVRRVHKGAAVFDQNKLTWINGQYLRDLPESQLLSLVSREWTQSGMPSALPVPTDEAWL